MLVRLCFCQHFLSGTTTCWLLYELFCFHCWHYHTVWRDTRNYVSTCPGSQVPETGLFFFFGVIGIHFTISSCSSSSVLNTWLTEKLHMQAFHCFSMKSTSGKRWYSEKTNGLLWRFSIEWLFSFSIIAITNSKLTRGYNVGCLNFLFIHQMCKFSGRTLTIASKIDFSINALSVQCPAVIVSHCNCQRWWSSAEKNGNKCYFF